jgi:hypothetical protein
MIKRLILFLLLASAAWWVYTEGLPKLRQRVDHLGEPLKPSVGMGASPEDVLCLQAARQALGAVSSKLGSVPPPPLDGDMWAQTLLSAGSEISEAESPCRCSTPACGKALDALNELEAAVNQIHGMISGSTSSYGNPANHLERAEQLLDEARDLAGG